MDTSLSRNDRARIPSRHISRASKASAGCGAVKLLIQLVTCAVDPYQTKQPHQPEEGDSDSMSFVP